MLFAFMGMISNHIQGKKAGNDFDDGDAKRKAMSGTVSLQTKDFSNCPSDIQFRGDVIDRRPAEIFRTDFITAMKIADNQTLPVGSHFELVDTWRQEWEKGVQVAVNPQALPKVSFRKKDLQIHGKRLDAFSLPKVKITIRSPELVHTNEKTTGCVYDLDDMDVSWLQAVRSSSKRGTNVIDEHVMEKTMALFERKCFENMAHAVATKKGLSIEYDDSTTCDVCLSPDTEESNEIVFCDACNMCVHQACYGISEVPPGTWLCRPCSRGVLSPPCIICPNKGGAMKRVKNSFEWIHVICAWWVPEVKIEDTENVEKMTVDKIPTSRKNLCCTLCRQKFGACIQCSVKRCVAAYHVTCAVKEGLEMKTIMLQEKDDVQHISYCKRHCIPHPIEKSTQRASSKLENQRLHELQKLQEEFFKLVDLRSSARELRLNRSVVSRLFGYWVLKRKANGNRPLVPLTTEQQEKLSGKQGIFLIREQIHVEMERYALLRQDLERLRNLCYLIIRRERTKREVHKASQDVFYKLDEVLGDQHSSMNKEDYDFFASGSSLMRFTKFPHYAIDGPPYADHLGEMEVQGNTLEAVNSLALEQKFDDVTSMKDVNLKFADSSQAPNFRYFECPGSEITCKGSKSHISSTDEICSIREQKSDACRGRESSEFNRTVDRVALPNCTKHDSGSCSNDQSPSSKIGETVVHLSGEQRNNLEDAEKGRENGKVDFVETEAEMEVSAQACVTNAIPLDTMSADEEGGPFNSSKYNSADSKLDSRLLNKPELASPYSKKTCGSPFNPSKVYEHSIDSSCVEASSQIVSVAHYELKRGCKRKLSDVNTSRRVLRKSARLRQELLTNDRVSNHKILDKALSNEQLCCNVTGCFDSEYHQGKYVVKHPTIPNGDSSPDSIVSLKEDSPSELAVVEKIENSLETITKVSQVLTGTSDKSYCMEDLHEKINSTDLLTSETGPSNSILTRHKKFPKTCCSTPATHIPLKCPVFAQDMQNIKGRDNLRGNKSDLFHPIPDSSPCVSSNIGNLREEHDNYGKHSELSSDNDSFEPNSDEVFRYCTKSDYVVPSVDILLNNEYGEKTNPNLKSEDQDSVYLKNSCAKTIRNLTAEVPAGIIDKDVSNDSEAVTGSTLTTTRKDSAKDIGLCKESSTMFNRTITVSSLDKNNCVSSYSIKSQAGVLGMNSDGNTIQKDSCVNFDFQFKRIGADTSNNQSIFNALNYANGKKNPIVLLNEVTSLKGVKTRCNINGLFECPRKFRKSSDIPSPAFPHSVIDDLIACPQRLTRGRTQLMMMGQKQETSSCKKPRKRRKTISGTYDKGGHITTFSESEPLIENLHLQRLTRRRVRSLGFMKSSLSDLQLLDGSDKEQSSSSHDRSSTSYSPSFSKVGSNEPIGHRYNTSNLPELIVSPTRLTRARVKSLGLEQRSDDFVLV